MPNNQMYDYVQSQSTGVSRNIVLQKTYRLLGLSFIPCAMGAALPYFTNFHIMAYGWASIIGFFAFFYGMCFAIEKNRYSNTGVALLMVFTFGLGTFLGSFLMAVTAISADGPKIIGMAAILTAAVFLTMSILAHRSKVSVVSLGNFMMTGAVVLIVAIIANLFLKMPVFSLALSAAIVIFSSVGIMYETKRVMDAGETSHISVALGLFIHIFNIFVSLVRIIMSLTSSR